MNLNKKEHPIGGFSKILTDATIGIIDITEEMHARVVVPPFLPTTPIQHIILKIARLTYRNTRKSSLFMGHILHQVERTITPYIGHKKTENQEKFQAVLNGVVGDYLAKTENPLQIKMQFRYQSKTLEMSTFEIEKSYTKVTAKILLMIHGSCMNDTQWTQKEHNHGLKLAEELGKTPIFLLYNTGNHISTNGKKMNALLDDLVQKWPVQVEEITLLAHSMGGLVSRSSIYYGFEMKSKWIQYLQNTIFLGTPHHGAPLEIIGNYLDFVLETIPYSKPFAKLGKIRSSGVTDLRYGNLIDEDWNATDRFKLQKDNRKHLPLPDEMNFYSVAAIKKEKTTYLSKKQGDGMVGVNSALGIHKRSQKNLNFKEDHTHIVYNSSHLDLLSSQEVFEKMKFWLS